MDCGEPYLLLVVTSTTASSYYLNVHRSDGSVFKIYRGLLFRCLTMQVFLRKLELINSPRRLGVYSPIIGYQ